MQLRAQSSPGQSQRGTPECPDGLNRAASPALHVRMAGAPPDWGFGSPQSTTDLCPRTKLLTSSMQPILSCWRVAAAESIPKCSDRQTASQPPFSSSLHRPCSIDCRRTDAAVAGLMADRVVSANSEECCQLIAAHASIILSSTARSRCKLKILPWQNMSLR